MGRHPETKANRERNHLLRDARLALTSRWDPRHPMSRAEFADEINKALVRLYPDQAANAKKKSRIATFFVNPYWVGVMERGERRTSSHERRAAVREVTGKAHDHELGLYPQRPRDADIPPTDLRAAVKEVGQAGEAVLDGQNSGFLSPHRKHQADPESALLLPLAEAFGATVAIGDADRPLSARQRDANLQLMVGHFMDWARTTDRRALLRELSLAAAIAAASPIFDSMQEEPRERFTLAIKDPTRVDHDVIRSIDDVLSNCMRQDDSLGPYAALDTVLAQRNLAQAMLSECPAELRSDLLSVFANLSRYAGWLAFDLRDFDGANYYYEQARIAAHEAQNAGLGALVLCNLSHLATWQRRPRIGIDHAVAARAWADQADDTLLSAYAADVAARAYAMDRQSTACRKELERARTYVNKPAPKATLVPFYNADLLDSVHGMCLLNLGEPAEAIEHATKSLKAIDPAYVRNVAFNSIYMGKAYLELEDVAATTAALSEAANMAVRNRSARLIQEVHGLREKLLPWESTRAVRELDERMRAYGFV